MIHREHEWQNLDERRAYAQSWWPHADANAIVCLVHGLGEHSGRYAPLAEFLTEHSIAVMALDSRGHGKSEGKRGHVESYRFLLHDITVLVDEAARLAKGTPRFLYGHSMGGSQVLYHALVRRRPLAGVVATGPALRPAFEPPGWKTALGTMLNKFHPSLTLSNELDPNEVSSDPNVVRAYVDDPLVHDRISVRLYNEWQASVRYLYRHALEFTQPVLLMHGMLDRLTSCPATEEFARKAGKRVTLKLWPGMKHEIHNEPDKQQVFDYLLSWLTARIKET